MDTTHIMVVNDDINFLDLMREVLAGEGYRVTIYGGSGAFLVIKQAKPDLVILDLRMAQIDEGMQILSMLRLDAVTRDLPVVLCSADSRYLAENAEHLRAYQVLTMPKPFDLDNLLECVREGLASRQVSAAGNGEDRVAAHPETKDGDPEPSNGRAH